MRLILKGKEILSRSRFPNAHQLHLASGVSYPTIDKYINRPEEIATLDMSVLAALLVKGAGLSKEDVLNLKIGDLFEIKD